MTDFEIKKAKSDEKIYFLYDKGSGLRLQISPHGSKIFQLYYRFEKRSRVMSLGKYPYLTLKHARALTQKYKVKIFNGIDPLEEKEKKIQEKLYMQNSQIHIITEKWFDKFSNEVSVITYKKEKIRFNKHIMPHFARIGKNQEIIESRQIGSIKLREITTILLELEKSNQETAHRTFMLCRRIWGFATALGVIEYNMFSSIEKRSFLGLQKTKHYPKITDEMILGELLRALDTSQISQIIKCAIKFVAIIPLRAGNLSHLKWNYIDWETNTLTIPRHEMKNKNTNYSDFILPLPPQAMAVLEEVKVITGWGEWVFHGVKNKTSPMVVESADKALRIMGFSDEKRGRKQTLHSFRGTFRSLCETYQQEHNATFETKEAVLDHITGNSVVNAYKHKANYFEQMKSLLNWWANFLDKLKNSQGREV